MPTAHRSDGRSLTDDQPLWAVALAFVLLMAGFGRRRLSPTSSDSRHPHRDEGRGRLAATPSEIPARGWKDILLRVYHNVSEHRVIALAAGVTFYSLLAIFPSIAALVAVYGLFADPATLAAQLDKVAGFMPGGAIEVIRDQLTRVASQGRGTLGATFVGSLAISLWSANAAVKSIFDTLNIVYGEREKRGFIKLNAISLAFTAAGIALILVAIGTMIILPPVLERFGISQVVLTAVKFVQWPALFLIITFALACVYRFGPSRKAPKWRWITWGSVFAALGWLIASLLFSWYASNFGSFNKTYGSLGAVIGFMMWIWISAIVILIGGELNAEIEHQTARDTTVGTPKPLGSRRAAVADTVG